MSLKSLPEKADCPNKFILDFGSNALSSVVLKSESNIAVDELLQQCAIILETLKKRRARS